MNDEVREAEDKIQLKTKLKCKKSKCLEEKKMEILEGCSKMLASSVSSKDVDTQQKPSTFALYVDEKLKLLDNQTRIFTEKRISDILFEAEMGSMPSSIPNSTITLIYDQPIPKLPLYLTIGRVWSNQRVLNETLFYLKNFYILTNMFKSSLTDDTLTLML